MTTDRTGAQTTVSAANGKHTIAVDGQTVSLADPVTPEILRWAETL